MWGSFTARPHLHCCHSLDQRTTTASKTYLRPCALAFEASAEVIHHDAGAPATEEDGVLATQSAAGTGDHDRLAIIPQL
jgi:hypothetical protein